MSAVFALTAPAHTHTRRCASAAVAMAGKAALEAEAADFETSEDVEVVPSFDSMGLKDELLRGIFAYGSRHRPLHKTHQKTYKHSTTMISI